MGISAGLTFGTWTMSTELIIAGGGNRPVAPPGQDARPSGGGRRGANPPKDQADSPGAPRPSGAYDARGERAAVSPRHAGADRPADDTVEIQSPVPARALVQIGPGAAPPASATTTFLAQQIAQETFSEGLYIDPHPAAIAAYRAAPSARVAFLSADEGVDLAV